MIYEESELYRVVMEGVCDGFACVCITEIS